MNFNEMAIDGKIKKALDEMGFTSATEVQQRAIPLMLDSNNVISKSFTGSGKTASFVIPIANRILTGASRNALILCPTRELAVQVCEEAKNINKYTGLRVDKVYGGHGIGLEMKELKKGVKILCATPGRFMDHVKRGSITPKSFDTVVLDEADRMLDMGFLDQIKDILRQISPKNIHLFSATLDGSVAKLIDTYIPKYMEVIVKHEILGTNIIETKVEVTSDNKFEKLLEYVKAADGQKVIIFVSTKRYADTIHEKLEDIGYRVSCIHGNHSQGSRETALRHFKAGKTDILVATDVAARGLQIDDLKYVINYDEAQTPEMHKHRIGRVGRMGEKGEAITFVSDSPQGFRGGNRRNRNGSRFGRSRDSGFRREGSRDRGGFSSNRRFGDRKPRFGADRARSFDSEGSEEGQSERKPRFEKRERFGSEERGTFERGPSEFRRDNDGESSEFRPRFNRREEGSDDRRGSFNRRPQNRDGFKPRNGFRGRRDGDSGRSKFGAESRGFSGPRRDNDGESGSRFGRRDRSNYSRNRSRGRR